MACSAVRRSRELITRFESLRFLATYGSKQRPRPSAAPNRPFPPPQSALQTAPATIKDGWTEVVHKETGLTYYWNERTGETTALGEPKPGPGGRVQPQRAVQQGTSLTGLVAAGAGIGLVFALLGRVL